MLPRISSLVFWTNLVELMAHRASSFRGWKSATFALPIHGKGTGKRDFMFFLHTLS
jgi:hypothetical protein